MKIATFIIYFILCIYLGFIPEQSDFTQIIIPYSGMFICYYFIAFKWSGQIDFKLLLLLSICVRAVLIFSFPNLSDDIYRFIWDGTCIHEGISPFQYIPSEIVGQYANLEQSLYELMNSPDYYSIYPPIGLVVSYLSTLPYDLSWQASARIFKCSIFIHEMGSIYIGIKILKLIGKHIKDIFIYALNPLIIIELMGNIHFEAFMMFYILLFIYLLLKRNAIGSAVGFSLAICSKLLPIMFAPLLALHLKSSRNIIIFGTTTIIVVTLLFLPFIDLELLHHLQRSIGLYVNKFEFNGSIYYVLRAIGYSVTGYNIIQTLGPLLSILTVVIISIQALLYNFRREPSPTHFILFLLIAFSTYLFLSPIVHPWYLTVPIGLCIFLPYKFPIVWSYLIFFTYINYSGSEYYENLTIVFFEYLLLILLMIYEISQGGKDDAKHSPILYTN